jgi:hypothetical protein
MLPVVGAAVDPAPLKRPIPKLEAGVEGFGPPNKPVPGVDVGGFELFASEKRPPDTPEAGVDIALFSPPSNMLPPV